MSKGADRDTRDSPQSDTNASRVGTARLHGFALYFKRYMGVSAVVSAAIPAPIAAFRLIPAYSAQASFLAVYASLFAFLILAFVFYSRHWIARLMFFQTGPDLYRTRAVAAWFPLLLILSSMGSIFLYHAQLNASIRDAANVLASVGITQSAAQILKTTDASDIPRATILIVLYLGIFLFAVAAFVLMALREYLQDLLGVTDRDLLDRPHKPKFAAAAAPIN